MPLSAEQIEQRRHGLGASEVPAVCGLNPWTPPIRVWLEKTGRAEPFPGNHNSRKGDLLEPDIIEWWARERGATDLFSPGTLQDSEHEWLLATPDQGAVVDGEIILCEAKYVGWRVAPRWEGNQAPDYVLGQTLIQQRVTGIHRCEVAAWLESDEPERICPSPYLPEVVEALIEIAGEFWREYVLKDVPPPPDASDAWAAYALSRWPKERRPLIEAPEGSERWAREYIEAHAAENAAKERKDEAGNHLKSFIGDAEGIRGLGWIATWREQQGSVSWKSVAESLGADPELVESHRGKPTRKLACKEC